MTRRIVDPGELPEVRDLLARLAEVDRVITPEHVSRRFGELITDLDAEGPPANPAPLWVEAHLLFWPWPGPAVQVTTPDGITVEFRPGSPYWPRNATVTGRGIDIKGLRLDLDADITPGGEPARIFRPWKTGVAGIDGAADVPERYVTAAWALCKRRAREAREALGVVTGQRKPP
jgi:hypothetical protein